jgi:hypothetical protein
MTSLANRLDHFFACRYAARISAKTRKIRGMATPYGFRKGTSIIINTSTGLTLIEEADVRVAQALFEYRLRGWATYLLVRGPIRTLLSWRQRFRSRREIEIWSKIEKARLHEGIGRNIPYSSYASAKYRERLKPVDIESVEAERLE